MSIPAHYYRDQSFVILTYGRSGSVLLASQIAHALGNVAVRFIKDDSEIPEKFEPAVYHSHLLDDRFDAAGCRRVFSLRRDPAQAVISWVVTGRTGIRHRPAGESECVCDSFVVTDWQQIQSLCRRLMEWYTYYADKVESADFVVFYEDLVQELPGDEPWQPTYPNKKHIIINYDSVLDFVRQELKPVENIHKFTSHLNLWDIYYFASVAREDDFSTEFASIS
jgi:hypothetical protein